MATLNKTLKTVSGDVIYPVTTSSQIVDFNTAVNTLIGNADVSGQISTAINNLIDGAPSTFDTLKEISDYISTHGSEFSSLVSTVNGNTTAINGKVDKSWNNSNLQNQNNVVFNTLSQSEQGISLNNQTNWFYTNEQGGQSLSQDAYTGNIFVGQSLEGIYKPTVGMTSEFNPNSGTITRCSLLGNPSSFYILKSTDSIQGYSENYEIIRKIDLTTALNSYALSSSLPTATSDLTNDSGFITSSALAGYALSSSLPTKTSDLTNDAGFITSSDIPSIPSRTSDLLNDAGFITSSAHDSTKQDVLTAGVGISIINNVISSTLNGVQYTIVESLPASGLTGVIYLIAKTGDTNDVYDEYIWVNNAFEKIGNTAVSLAGYATEAWVGQQGFLTQHQDLTTYAQLSDIPTKVSDLTNDTGFITSSALSGFAASADIPTATSDLTNDSGFITSSALSGYALSTDIPTDTGDLTNNAGFITSSDLSGYLTSSTAASTYLTSSAAASTYLTTSAASSTYATKSELGDIETILQSLVSVSSSN